MRLVPPLPIIKKHSQSTAEKRVAEVLAGVKLKHDATAYWSVALSSHAWKKQAEADFVIVTDDLLIVLEVKGGGVRHEDGQWSSISRDGTNHPLAESPMQQANGVGYALTEKIGGKRKQWVRWEALVVTPDIDAVPDGLGWDTDQWLTRRDMSTDAMTDRLRNVVANADPFPPNRQREGVKTRQLLKWLEHNITLLPSPLPSDEWIAELQHKATEAQANVLAGCDTQQMVVTGGAGTGKTLVMAELARREAGNLSEDQPPKVLVTFKSHGLTDYVSALVADFPNITVKPFDQLGDETFDVVLIDEAQDLMNAEAMDVLGRSVVGGLDDGRWRIFLDPNNQTHVDGVFDQDTWEFMRDQASLKYRLDKNVRNTKLVVVSLQTLLNADLGDPGIAEGEKPYWDLKSSGDLDAARRRADELVSQGADPSQVCLIDCSGRDHDTTLANRFRLTTPSAIKGLEVNHVIVFGLPSPMTEKARSDIYVAMTRPRISLSVLATPMQAAELAAMSDATKR